VTDSRARRPPWNRLPLKTDLFAAGKGVVLKDSDESVVGYKR
jgi:hypothetical protein